MPIFSDLSLYYGGASTSFSPSFYSNQYGASSLGLSPRTPVFTGFSSGLSSTSLYLPSAPPPRISKYSPLLPTISESSTISALPRRPVPRILSPRAVPAYKPPRPIDIDTADIDVSTPRKRPDRISRDRNDPEQGTIKRGRTVVRLHTRKLKENPGLATRKKTPGEKLVEKFLIRDKSAEEAKRRKLEEEAQRMKEVYKQSEPEVVEKPEKPVENGEHTQRRKSIQDCLLELESVIGLDGPEREFLAQQNIIIAENHAESQDSSKDTESESDALDRILSETEKEVEPTTSITKKQRRPSEKTGTVKKRPKKRDKNATIKRSGNEAPAIVDSPPAVSEAPAPEKSLLQRRNTKKIRRSSRDLDNLTLDLSVDHFDRRNSIPTPESTCSTPGISLPSKPVETTSPTLLSSAHIASAPASRIPSESINSTPTSSAKSTPTSTPPSTPTRSVSSTPVSSKVSTPFNSTSSTPVSSAPSTPPSTPTLKTKSESPSLLDKRKPKIPKTKAPNRDLFPFKTKFSDVETPNKISVDVSIENVEDSFKKSPLKFVVEEIKVEETPKSPKSPKMFHYEVTVEESPFQRQTSEILEDITEENETDVEEFWNKEDAEAHKIYKLAKNISKFNEKENERKDCNYIPESKNRTFLQTNGAIVDNQKKTDDLNTKMFKTEEKQRENKTKDTNKGLKDIPGKLLPPGKRKDINDKETSALLKSKEGKNQEKVPETSQLISKVDEPKVGIDLSVKPVTSHSKFSQQDNSSSPHVEKSEQHEKTKVLQVPRKELDSKTKSDSQSVENQDKLEKKKISKDSEFEVAPKVFTNFKSETDKIKPAKKSSMEVDKSEHESRNEVKADDRVNNKNLQSGIKIVQENVEEDNISVNISTKPKSVELGKNIIEEKFLKTKTSETFEKSSKQKTELSLENDQPSIPAWKKALIAKNQANTTSKSTATLKSSILETQEPQKNPELTETIPNSFDNEQKSANIYATKEATDHSSTNRSFESSEKGEIKSASTDIEGTALQTKPPHEEKEPEHNFSENSNKSQDLPGLKEKSDDKFTNSKDRNSEKPAVANRMLSEVTEKTKDSMPDWKRKILEAKKAESLLKASETSKKDETSDLKNKDIEIATKNKEKLSNLHEKKSLEEMKLNDSETVSDVQKSKPSDTLLHPKVDESKIGDAKGKILGKKKPSDLKLTETVSKSPETSPVGKVKPRIVDKMKSGENINDYKSSKSLPTEKPKPLTAEKGETCGSNKSTTSSAENSAEDESKCVNIEKVKSVKNDNNSIASSPAKNKTNEIKSDTNASLKSPVDKTKPPIIRKGKSMEPKVIKKASLADEDITNEDVKIKSSNQLTDNLISQKEVQEVKKTESAQSVQKNVSAKNKISTENKSNKKSSAGKKTSPKLSDKKLATKTTPGKKTVPNKSSDKNNVEETTSTDAEKSKIEPKPQENKSKDGTSLPLETKKIPPVEHPKPEMTSSGGKTNKTPPAEHPEPEMTSPVGKIPGTPSMRKMALSNRRDFLRKSGMLAPGAAPTSSLTDSSSSKTPTMDSKKNDDPRPTSAAKDEDSSEDEDTETEEETETETDDDGEEVSPGLQRASTSSEDSGFDSLPTSVPGSPAFYKKGPDSKGTH
ncbi:hypothetical protein L9F63_005313 [Diploptera punctata]|uniref:Uncharacterized protein n=1 Tax=Diploptera punctata TaxID=6984 RepID=A0AAD8E5W1_DIPPU|nr:hypothetical protein L9F63_005313 [Diploptera punctata]